jgi:hypothetical protein
MYKLIFNASDRKKPDMGKRGSEEFKKQHGGGGKKKSGNEQKIPSKIILIVLHYSFPSVF